MRIQTLAILVANVLGQALGNRRAEIFRRAERIQADALAKRAGETTPTYDKGHSKTRFLTTKTKKFKVDSLPDVHYDIGELYAGNLPISGAANESRQLFFVFAPATDVSNPKEITVWLNGGPGCSSLGGFLQENGPFLWQPGTYLPTKNPYAWNNLTNMLWIEQPVGVGFTEGDPSITNEVELAQQFLGFYSQFVKTFGVQGFDLYLTGESYAGYYIPYVADAFIKANNSNILLKGVSINDPIIGDETVQTIITIQPFVEYWSKLLDFNSTYLAGLAKQHKDCGYATYLQKYFTFPAPQHKFPQLPDPYYTGNGTCDTFDSYVYAATEINPCFNYYHISDTCPFLWTVLGATDGGYEPPGASVYFNRTDVQKAIHATVGTDWSFCTDINVFNGPADNPAIGDTSLGPAQNDVLRRVIEHTNNVMIGSGNLDGLLNTNGTLLALQNTTWNGYQGFKQYPSKDFFVPYHPEYNAGALASAGVIGSWVSERGLTFYQVRLSGHQLLQYAPGAAYRALEFLLGRIDSLNQGGGFTTQKGNL